MSWVLGSGCWSQVGACRVREQAAAVWDALMAAGPSWGAPSVVVYIS